MAGNPAVYSLKRRSQDCFGRRKIVLAGLTLPVLGMDAGCRLRQFVERVTAMKRPSVALTAAVVAVAMVFGAPQAGMADDVYTVITASGVLLLLGWLRRRRNHLMP